MKNIAETMKQDNIVEENATEKLARTPSRKRCSQDCLSETATVAPLVSGNIGETERYSQPKTNDCDSLIESEQIREDVIDLPLPEDASDPDDYLLQLLESMCPRAKKLKVKAADELDSFFPTITEEQMARYTMKVVHMARVGDVQALRDYHAEAVASNNENVLDCFNRFGEGLLNMACRRGFVPVVDLLLNDPVSLTVRVRDDCGRTPLHDACWSPEPQLQICAWILQRDPSLFLVADKRGYTPFQYARQSDWPVWCKFLYDNREHLQALGQNDVAQTFLR